MDQLSEELKLRHIDRELDEITGAVLNERLPQAFRHEIVLHYVGFPFWDVLTFALPEWRDAGEHDEIRIDRISPVDAVSLRSGAEPSALKGADLRHFAGFLSRPMRESDYLWGRLDGAERLIDIIADAAQADAHIDVLEIKNMKRAAFRTILDAEEKFLEDKALIATIRTALNRELRIDNISI
jgi:hypothetical protein